MLIKFFSHGKNEGSRPIGYVLKSEGRENAPPEILKGDPETTCELIDSIERQWKYTSGVVSFAIEDAPSEEQQEQVMNLFERTAFAGLESDQYDILWVRHQHTEGGRIELHFITPRLELTTGKALNIAPPNWQSHFDPLQNTLNFENDWADPHSPERARNTQRSAENALRAKDRESIGNFIETLVGANLVANRADIVNALQENGLEIHRQGQNYISVKDPLVPGAKPIRLKGAFYEQDWTNNSRENGSAAERDRAGNRTRAIEARGQLEERITRRAIHNGQQYKRPSEQHNPEIETRLASSDLQYRGRDFHYVGFNRVHGSFNQIEVERIREINTRNGHNGNEIKEIANSDRGTGNNHEQQRNLYNNSERDSPRALHLRRKKMFQNTNERLDHEQNNGFRERVIGCCRKVNEWFNERNRDIRDWLDRQSKDFIRSRRRAIDASRKKISECGEFFTRNRTAFDETFERVSSTSANLEQHIGKVRKIVEERHTATNRAAKKRDKDRGFSL